MSLCAALITAAGSSLRFGEDKLTALVQGQPLISYSLRAFHAVACIEEIVLVVAAGREEEFSQIIDAMKMVSLKGKINIVSGGEDRHASVQFGLCALSSRIEWVAIHDGARPLIFPSIIEDCVRKAQEYGAAALAARVTDTLHRADAHDNAEESVDRSYLWAVQTPQVFRKVDLIDMKPQGEQKSPTDEVSVFLQHGVKVHLVENREPNLKVTYRSDLNLVNAYVGSVMKS